MLPQIWKVRIKLTNKISDNLWKKNYYVKKKIVPIFLRKIWLIHFEQPTKLHERWKEDLNTEIVNWDLIYKIPFYCTKNNQFSVFQLNWYKILHRILSTNSLLFKCKLKETQHCNICNETKETILHLFWECNIVKSLWLEMAEI